MGDAIAVGSLDPLDESTQPETAELVGHPPLGEFARIEAEQWREIFAEILVGKPVGEETKDQQRAEQGMDKGVPEAHRGDALIVDDQRLREIGDNVVADRAIVADSLDAQEASVGLKADLPKCGEVLQQLADAEVASVVDRGLGAKPSVLLVVLLDTRVLVVDVQRGHDAMGDDAGPKRTGSGLGDPAGEDHLDPVRTAEIEILADDLFEEDSPRNRSVQDLGQRKLGLEDRDGVPETGATILWRERMRKQTEPLAQKAVDLPRCKTIADALHPPRLFAGQDSVVQCFVANPLPVELALEVLVAVDAELGCVREARSELEEERAEVAIYAIEVVVVDQCCRT